jgi:hypothetical protein
MGDRRFGLPCNASAPGRFQELVADTHNDRIEPMLVDVANQDWCGFARSLMDTYGCAGS